MNNPNVRPKALIVNSPINDYSVVDRPNTEQLPAFGLAYIATELEAAGHNVGIVDAEVNALSPEEAANVINQAGPEWVGMNLLTPTYELAARIAENLDPHIKLIAGAAHAKAVPEKVLRDPRFEKLEGLALEDGEVIM